MLTMISLFVTIMIVENGDIPFKERVCINLQDDEIYTTNLIHIYNFIMNENIINYDFVKCNIFFYDLNNFKQNTNTYPYDMDTYLSKIQTKDLLLFFQM